jgi:hypothetical protein
MVDLVLRQTHERQGLILENRDIRAMVESHVPLGNRVTLKKRDFNEDSGIDSQIEALNEKNRDHRRRVWRARRR